MTKSSRINDFIDKLDAMHSSAQLMCDEIDISPAIKLVIGQMTAIMKIGSAIISQQVNVTDAIEEEKRLRSVVVMNYPESKDMTSTARAKDDVEQVNKMLDCCNIQALPVVYRLGEVVNNRPRLMKVEFQSKRHATEFLKAKGKLATQFPTAKIRPSMTLQQRQARFLLNDECKKKRETAKNTGLDDDFVVYNDLVILRKDISELRNKR